MSWITGLFSFFGSIGKALDLFRDRRNQKVGRLEEQANQQGKVIENVEKSKRANSVRDGDRSERLRDKYDRTKR